MKRSLGLWKRPYAGVNHLIVGLGNWYYPLSRESVGLYALERYAQRYSLVWDFIPNICSDALASKTGIALIKPKTYQQKDMGKAVAMATEAMNLTIDDVTILHYDANLPCGQVRYRTGALDAPNVAVQSIINAFDTERLNRVSIGIKPVSEDEVFVPTIVQAIDKRYLDNFNDIWIRNVLSDTERPLVDKASDKVTDELLHSATNTTDNTFSRLNTL